MSPPMVIVLYAALAAGASLVGGWVPSLVRLTHERTQLMMSFVAGLMLGVGLFHMLPHAAAGTDSLDQAVWWLMVGLMTMFFLQRFLHFHQHEAPQVIAPTAGHEHAHHDEHAHEHHHGHHSHGSASSGSWKWLGVAIGLMLHTLLDGVALAASVEAEASVRSAGGFLGLSTFLAICLHKPLDAMAVTALMRSEGRSAGARHAVNGLFALMCPIGAGLFYVTAGQLAGSQLIVISCALAFSAGVFLCISLADLLPEIQFHSHDRLELSLALLIGVSLAYALVAFA